MKPPQRSVMARAILITTPCAREVIPEVTIHSIIGRFWTVNKAPLVVCVGKVIKGTATGSRCVGDGVDVAGLELSWNVDPAS